MKHCLFGFIILLFLYNQSYSQSTNFVRRYINRLVNDTNDIAKPQFMIYPNVAFSPETSWEFGIVSLYVFYAKRDTNNRLSEINGFTFFTLQKQYGIWFDHALYSHQDKWFVLGRIRLQSFPLLYFGIGSNTPSHYQARVDANQIQIKERILRKLYKNTYLGIESDFQRLSAVNFISQEPTLVKPLGNQGSANLGFGLGLIYDNRHNVLNVRNGFFSEIAFLRYSQAWKSSFTFTNVVSDTRIYKSINKTDVFAAQLLGQFNSGNTPFNQLAMIGGENMMRGYYTGRFRDNNQIATQLEYRFLPLSLGFTKRLGATVFGSGTSVFSNFKTYSTKSFVWAGGAGLRYLLFAKKDIYTRLDLAFTKEGKGIYIFIGEAF